MPTLNELIAKSIDAREARIAREIPVAPAGAHASASARIRRARRVRAASAAGVAATAVAAVAVLPLFGVSLALPAGQPQPGDIATVEVPLNGETAIDQPWNLFGTCGEPIETLTSDHGFSFDPSLKQDGTNEFFGVETPRFALEEPRITYVGPTYSTVTVMLPFLVYAQDGVIVGFDIEQSTQTVAVISDGWVGYDTVIPMPFEQGPNMCSAQDGTPKTASDAFIAAGTYDVYAVTAIVRNPELLASDELAARGFRLADPGSGVWNPGSIDCRKEVAWDQENSANAIPAQCEPFGVEGVTIDDAAGTATLPYTVPWGEGDLNVRLISQPTSVKIDQDVTYGDIGWRPKPEPEPPLECGTQRVGTVGPGWPIMVRAEDQKSAEAFTLPETGADTDLAVTFDVGDVRTATITLPRTMPATLISNGWVVGHATASFPSGTTLNLDRSVDYAHATVKLSDYVECPDLDDALGVRTRPTRFEEVILEGEVTYVDQDGAEGTQDRIGIVPNPWWE